MMRLVTADSHLAKHTLSIRSALATIAFLLSGCTSNLLNSFQHEQSTHCRIDNADRDNLWDTSDRNGNGVIDDGETIGPVFDFAALSSPAELSATNLASSQAQPSATGYWGVNITFSTPPEYLRGFRDYFGKSSSTSVVVTGAGGFGAVDDLNGDSTSAVNVLRDPNGDPVAIITDFQDQIEIPISLSLGRILVAPRTEADGIQISQQHRIISQANEIEESPEVIELSYGVRYLRLDERLLLEANAGALGDTRLDSTYDNRLLGPQFALNWIKARRHLGIQIGTTLMVGYNFAEANQTGTLSQRPLTGGLNRIDSSSRDDFYSSTQHEDFASIVELNATGSYDLRHNVAVTLGYRAVYLTGLRHAAESIAWTLPSFGLQDPGGRDAWLDGLHAGIEWRR